MEFAVTGYCFGVILRPVSLLIVDQARRLEWVKLISDTSSSHLVFLISSSSVSRSFPAAFLSSVVLDPAYVSYRLWHSSSQHAMYRCLLPLGMDSLAAWCSMEQKAEYESFTLLVVGSGREYVSLVVSSLNFGPSSFLEFHLLFGMLESWSLMSLEIMIGQLPDLGNLGRTNLEQVCLMLDETSDRSLTVTYEYWSYSLLDS